MKIDKERSWRKRDKEAEIGRKWEKEGERGKKREKEKG